MRINYKICHLPVIYTPVSCHIKEKQHENFRKQKNRQFSLWNLNANFNDKIYVESFMHFGGIIYITKFPIAFY